MLSESVLKLNGDAERAIPSKAEIGGLTELVGALQMKLYALDVMVCYSKNLRIVWSG